MADFINSLFEQPMDAKTKALLNKYMNGAVKEIGYSTKSKAEEKAGSYARDFVEGGKADKLSMRDIERKQKEVKKELKNYGFQEKFNYAMNIKAHEEKPILPLLKTTGVAVAMTAVMLDSVARGDVESTAVAAGIGVVGAMTAGLVYYAGAAKSEEQDKKITEYTDLKHAQLALKQLKVAVTAKKDREAAPEKAAKKAAYKAEVAQYMAMGNPGGFVSGPLALQQKAKTGR